MKNIVLILLLFQQTFTHAQHQLVVNNDFEIEVLGEELQVYNDVSGRLTIDEVIYKEFINNEAARPNLGFTRGAYWVRTSLTNKADLTDYFLLINQPVLDTLQVFILNKDESLISSYVVGENYSKKNVLHNTKRNYRIPIKIATGETQKIYLRIATAEQIVLPVYIATPDGTWKLYSDSNLLFGSYFGI